MHQTIEFNTGNPIVDSVGQINMTGNVIPETWYQTIINDKGKVSTMAILILSDIVYWYRPTEVRDELTGSVRFEKKFAADLLQKSYDQICDKFNISKKQAREALITLENLGVIKRHLRTIDTPGGTLGNVMFIELIVDGLYEVTYPGDTPLYKKGNSYLQKSKEVFPKKETAIYKNVKTNTKNTTKTTTKITTTISDPPVENKTDAVVVDEKTKSILSGLNMSDKDMATLVDSCDGDLDRLSNARSILDNYTGTITNVVGFLIKAIENNYQDIGRSSVKRNKSSSNFNERHYDYDEIERMIARGETL